MFFYKERIKEMEELINKHKELYNNQGGIMNILFLVSRYPDKENETILEKDLVRIFNEKGHKCFVGTIIEKKYNQPTYEFDDNGIKVLKVKTGNMFNDVSAIEKGITVTTLPFQVSNEIIKKYRDERIDLVIAYSPFMSNPQLINRLKKKFQCKTLMMMWDIFPQNAWDLGIIKNKLIFNYFKYKEHQMLKTFDYIACNSEGNIKYLNENYKFRNDEKLFLSRNCEYDREKQEIDKLEVRKKYNLNTEDIILVFGGNMGIPQKLDNILEIAKQNQEIKFIFLGNGTEKQKLIENSEAIENVEFLGSFKREEYEEFIQCCDAGIISLNENYTVPNFPAKVTGYLKVGLPIFASLDPVAYNDLGNFIEKNQVGNAVLAINGREANKKLKNFLNSEKLEEYKKNTRVIFKKELEIENAYNAIIKNTTGDEVNV